MICFLNIHQSLNIVVNQSKDEEMSFVSTGQGKNRMIFFPLSLSRSAILIDLSINHLEICQRTTIDCGERSFYWWKYSIH